MDFDFIDIIEGVILLGISISLIIFSFGKKKVSGGRWPESIFLTSALVVLIVATMSVGFILTVRGVI
ncbi:MAG: hypothetical protein NXI16_13985 [Alphaproteobacteria bacterium]|nr:hypothetical protein [Alphaproteobacteria bacterium]